MLASIAQGLPASCSAAWLLGGAALLFHALLVASPSDSQSAARLCIVLQDVPLFNETIYYNIMYGSLGASQEEVFR